MEVSTVSLVILFVVAAVPLAPTEVSLIGMGVAAAQRDLPLAPVILVAAAGCLLSDLVLYGVGRHGVSRLLDRLRGRPAVDAGAHWLSGQLERRGVTALVIARWLPAGGTAGSLLAGSLRWSPPMFVAASGIGVVLWSSYASGLGYVGGSLMREPHTSLLVSLAVALALGAVTAAVMRRRHEA
ncbi:DedA family protein [Saccharomonospora saliphila]|uniref:DedA family protein n=1 Tax=Saccharomonospora saliphila TaxID=369829 RepID=UPI000363C599|nr:DedA family protein [Saccharomonospora saliphila]